MVAKRKTKSLSPHKNRKTEPEFESMVVKTLREEIFGGGEIKRDELIRNCGLKKQEVSEIIKSERRLTVRLAMKLGQGTHITARTWMGIDADDRIRIALKEMELRGERYVPYAERLKSLEQDASSKASLSFTRHESSSDELETFSDDDLEDWDE